MLKMTTDVMITPKSLNIALNQTAEINCTARAQQINWIVNGSPINQFNNKVFDDHSKPANKVNNLTLHSLVILGSSVSNGTNITCISSSPYAESKPVPVLVQGENKMGIGAKFILMSWYMYGAGLLESVSNLTVTLINSTTVFISWHPPFTLEGVPILGYNVTITNTTSGENETMSVEGDTTMLYYSIDHPDPDNNFTVTVVPINKVGAGEPLKSDQFVILGEI